MGMPSPGAKLRGWVRVTTEECAREGRLQSQIGCALAPSPLHSETPNHPARRYFTVVDVESSIWSMPCLNLKWARPPRKVVNDS
jgi:hypothetical protein